MSNEEIKIEEVSAENLVEEQSKPGPLKKIRNWFDDHPIVKKVAKIGGLALATGGAIVVIKIVYDQVKDRFFPITVEEPTEDNYEDKTNKPTETENV